ncbi:hypothetical protein IWX84_002242 [Flavobacterium sp. CG_9.10]|uniref:RES domain-containing protein n=1 Tax=Flavobacterium sp. CG_9.10 TaxID=2787729 RepID=UPI0018CA6DF2|nr:RES domain-containing protein [Flavobacterium sp. CG_9.10]MBG6111358.1 hypothetical protein [Flavobacterium sp. CG_9.10]
MKKFPLKKEVLESLNRFKSMDTKTATIDELEKEFMKLVTNFSFVLISFPKGIKSHRIRINEGQKDFSQLSELWYPPKKAIRKIGRCNDVEEQILYLAGGGHTALKETNPPVGSLITCIECETIKKIELIDIGAIKYIDREQYLKQYSTIHKNILENHYQDNELFDLDNMLKEFIIEEFTRKVDENNEHLYKKSIAISKFFFKAPGVNGILYPSIKSDLKELNYAIPAVDADKYFKPIRVDVFKMVYVEELEKIGLTLTKGSYDELNFEKPIKYSAAKPIENWAKLN